MTASTCRRWRPVSTRDVQTSSRVDPARKVWKSGWSCWVWLSVPERPSHHVPANTLVTSGVDSVWQPLSSAAVGFIFIFRHTTNTFGQSLGCNTRSTLEVRMSPAKALLNSTTFSSSDSTRMNWCDSEGDKLMSGGVWILAMNFLGTNDRKRCNAKDG